jgi:hypothetical protein
VKVSFEQIEPVIAKQLKEIQRNFAEAGKGAVRDAAKLAVTAGRENIAAAGNFRGKWQTGLRSKFYANKGIDPAAVIFHRIGLVSVFETGITISGARLLWLPIEQNLPKRIKSPKQYGKKLVSVNVAGKPPLLFDANNRLLGPLFVGVPSATIRKRFDLYRIFAAAADRIPEFYTQRIKGLD